ncbi:ribosome-associated protein [Andreprevotia lacus DSM 23236]|jgi:ribosome-associated protein|uniref:Dual-action ribosomal maturation protein DarP n=1 Tax=Andreprevotia lacus DSM 23236 TaxID=1121001 RepID=A0A1W1XN73_9NEIS|nr:ribosome biogenesis factor YjgA [Andreprevotia lacus]SMC25305.1 ribosome-associated protein [Andreprevotia lacus DSM 23236]
MARHNSRPDAADDDFEPVSKSQLKRESDALQEMGEALIPLDKKLLQSLNLPERLYNALIEAKKLTANGAVARQKQYIGKWMRQIDPAPIKELLDAIAGVSDRHNAWLHQLERQRDQLVDDPKALESFIAAHPQADVQQLRQLIRNIHKEREQQKPPKAFRELFQLLKSYHPEPALPGAELDKGDDDDKDET